MTDVPERRWLTILMVLLAMGTIAAGAAAVRWVLDGTAVTGTAMVLAAAACLIWVHTAWRLLRGALGSRVETSGSVIRPDPRAQARTWSLMGFAPVFFVATSVIPILAGSRPRQEWVSAGFWALLLLALSTVSRAMQLWLEVRDGALVMHRPRALWTGWMQRSWPLDRYRAHRFRNGVLELLPAGQGLRRAAVPARTLPREDLVRLLGAHGVPSA
jgi:hypothetical protein